MKMFDLQALRSMFSGPLSSSMEADRNYELILGVPSSHSLEIPDHVHEKIKEYKNGLIRTADEENIRVIDVETVEAAVERIYLKSA